MYSLMGRPAIVDTEQLLSAARELFLSQGYGVTTAAIARRAGISEGSIFKRFPTKESLFFAALGVPEPAWLAEIPQLAGQNDPQHNLQHILLSLIAFFRVLVPRMIMLWSNRGEFSHPFKDATEAPPMRGLRALTDYFSREVALRRARPCSPEALARLLLGAAQNYAFFEIFGAGGDKRGAAPCLDLGGAPLLAEDFAKSIAETIWLGLRPADDAPPEPEAHRPKRPARRTRT